MKIFIHKIGKWYNYLIPKQLNTITRKENQPKIYKWLFFGYICKIKS